MQSVRINKNLRLELIKRNRNLLWYVSEDDKDNISLDALVEAVLNYGDAEAVKQLIN